MKYLKILFFLFLLIGTIVILRNHQDTVSQPYHTSVGRAFGTTYRVVYQASAPQDSIIQWSLSAVDSSLSMFNPQSTLACINSGSSNKVDTLFRHVFELAQKVSEATHGAFDPTVAPAVNAWGFGPEGKRELSREEIDGISHLVGYQQVSLMGDSLIFNTESQVTLDFGAIAKGFAVDYVAQKLREAGVTNYMVEIGGEVVVSGVNEKGESWRIGVQSPDAHQATLQKVIQLKDAAMATSGNYRNYYVNDEGVKVAHTIDPRTACPVSHSLLSATVLAPSCAIADAYATAFMVLGVEDSKRILENRPELSVYFIYSEQDSIQVYSTID